MLTMCPLVCKLGLRHTPYHRIFSRTARSNLQQPTLDWESAAVRAAALVVVLSKSDAEFVRQHLLPPGLQRPVKVSDTSGLPDAPLQSGACSSTAQCQGCNDRYAAVWSVLPMLYRCCCLR